MPSAGLSPIPLEEVYRKLDPLSDAAGESFYCNRPEDPLGQLRLRLQFADDPKGLFAVAGHIGTGKTTEIKRLMDSLSDKYESSYKQVDSILGSEPADDFDFMLLVLSSLLRHLSGKRTAITTARELLFKIFGQEPPVFNDLERLTHSRPDRNTVRNKFDQIRREFLRILTELKNECLKKTELPPLVVLDGFDKVPCDQFEQLFYGITKWGELPVAVITTVPMSFAFTSVFARHKSFVHELAVVPAVRVVHRNRGLDTDGLNWFRSLLQARNALQRFESQAVERLVIDSGGIVREFLRSCRDAVLECAMRDGTSVTLAHAQIVRDRQKTEIARLLTENDVRLLISVNSTGRVIQTEDFLRLIDMGWIIEQKEEANWYSVHPLVFELIGEFYPEFVGGADVNV